MPLPSTASAFNSFISKKKPRDSTTDELSLVKAAAWAWYQRGSGSDGKPIGEFDITRTHRVLDRPSRYKLEAMKIAAAAAAQEPQVSTTPDPSNTTDTEYSLLDNFEVQSISKRLDQFIGSSSNKLLSAAAAVDDLTRNTNVSRNVRVKKSKGFWLKHAVICGTRQDVVVDDRPLGVNRRPEKRAAVVKLATCRPRVTHA
ncbi:Tetratricopeptide repeat-like superfamily protein [Melia azedarach]|uniref:Tetratricopeptide repeat-like superfamily protein n=1 Tax=Melia azedarach TaxID=155640 RepID=A0ACC1X6E7_MELAZ|nr:Tetratricopeptide repeat-like superfamily protein [Melia azedarach]